MPGDGTTVPELLQGHPWLQDSPKHYWLEMLFLNAA